MLRGGGLGQREWMTTNARDDAKVSTENGGSEGARVRRLIGNIVDFPDQFCAKGPGVLATVH